MDLHCAEGNVDGGTAHFNSDRGIQATDGRLERLKEPVLIRENPIFPRLDSKADAKMHVLCGRLEPCFALRL